MNKILIKIEGGLIQSIGVTDPQNTEIVVIDYDEFENAGFEEGEDTSDIADRAVYFASTYKMLGDGSFAAQIEGEDLSENEEAVKKQLELCDKLAFIEDHETPKP
jgi:hypothetical protein